MPNTPAAEPPDQVAVLPSFNQIDPEERLQQVAGGQYEQTAENISKGLHSVVLKGGEPARRAADFLHGTWLGHPLHTVLTDVTIGAWLFGSFFDVLSLGSRRKSTRRAADQLITLGTLSAVPTALAGMADYSAVPKEAAATGLTHGLVNGTALTMYTLSLWLRRIGLRPLAILFSGLGLGLILLSSWLGGEMSYRYRVGANQAKEGAPLKRWQAVAADADLREHKPLKVEVKEQPILLYRHDGEIFAIGAVCSHAGGPLEKGCFTGAQVECPWHQSVFDLSTGRVAHGPALYPEPRFETRVRNGQVEIRSAP